MAKRYKNPQFKPIKTIKSGVFKGQTLGNLGKYDYVRSANKKNYQLLNYSLFKSRKRFYMYAKKGSKSIYKRKK
jgi:hypothetical protein